MVKAFNSHKNWLIIDPSYVFDYDSSDSFTNLEFEVGQVLGEVLFGGVGSVYFNPGLSFGAEREFDWKIEVGFKLVGF